MAAGTTYQISPWKSLWAFKTEGLALLPQSGGRAKPSIIAVRVVNMTPPRVEIGGRLDPDRRWALIIARGLTHGFFGNGSTTRIIR